MSILRRLRDLEEKAQKLDECLLELEKEKRRRRSLEAWLQNNFDFDIDTILEAKTIIASSKRVQSKNRTKTTKANDPSFKGPAPKRMKNNREVKPSINNHTSPVDPTATVLLERIDDSFVLMDDGWAKCRVTTDAVGSNTRQSKRKANARALVNGSPEDTPQKSGQHDKHPIWKSFRVEESVIGGLTHSIPFCLKCNKMVIDKPLKMREHLEKCKG